MISEAINEVSIKLYVYLCICVYVCLTLYVCLCVCVYICVCVCMFVCMYVCVYVCVYVCLFLSKNKNLVNCSTINITHLVKFINTHNTPICQHHSTRLQTPLTWDEVWWFLRGCKVISTAEEIII